MTGRQTSGRVPDLVSPMHVSTGSGPPPTGSDWVVELAWTGHRCVAYVEPGRRTRLLSANDVSMTDAYPELGPPLERRSPPGGMVLDGTLVARGEEHAPRARLLMRRHGLFRPSEQRIREVPVDFQVADLLWLDGHSTADRPYRERRELLEGLGFDSAPIWTTSPLPASELATMLRLADTEGVDFLHARHLGSRYHPGGRSPLWLKVPVPRIRQVVVGGWTPTDLSKPDAIASLLLGVPDGNRLRYVGRVGVSGEQRRQVAALRRLRRKRSPFADEVPADAARHAIWVQPRLVGLVEFLGWATGGRLRLPHWRGLIEQADADDSRWACPSASPSRGMAEPPPPEAAAASPPEPEPAPAPDPPLPAQVQTRRLEQHFFYNSLNTITSLIRTDPSRARELLIGFADLSRTADEPGESTLGRELDAVRGYLQLEQARFGERLQVELDVDPAFHEMPVAAMRVLVVVREAVQQGVEPHPDGGVLAVTAREACGGCVLTVTAPLTTPTDIVLQGAQSITRS
ncbi:MAG: histidine kinase [Pseudonocardia sp.]